MKLTLFSNVLLATMLVFAAACGKDKKSSGSSSGYYSNLTTGVSGTVAQTNLQTYINAVESNQNVYGPVNVTKAKYSCSTKNLFGISFLPVQSCSQSSSSETVYIVLNQTRGTIKPALATVLTPPTGYSLGNITQAGNIVTIQHYKGTDIYEYTVDMGRHAAVNPVQIKDTANMKVEYVISPSI